MFQVHGVDGAGVTVLTKRLRCAAVPDFIVDLEPLVVAMEACATAHHRARALPAMGHEVRLVPPRNVKRYVRRNKTDAAAAAAICETAGRLCGRNQPTAGDDPGHRPDHRLGADGQHRRPWAFATARQFAAQPSTSPGLAGG